MVIAGGTVADVYTGRWIEANVEIADGRIVYVGPPRNHDDADTIDAHGKLVVPGYIEPHSHPGVRISARTASVPLASSDAEAGYAAVFRRIVRRRAEDPGLAVALRRSG